MPPSDVNNHDEGVEFGVPNNSAQTAVHGTVVGKALQVSPDDNAVVIAGYNDPTPDPTEHDKVPSLHRPSDGRKLLLMLR